MDIVIDTDPGIDDAVALLMALSLAGLRVRAITVVAGNCSVKQGLQNALGIVELMGATGVPVARGADRPLKRPAVRFGAEVHGENGIGGATLAVQTRSADPKPAPQMLVDTVRENQGRVTIVALAPLTNLALAIELWPGIVHAVRHVVVMGGALSVAGNASAQAECNIYNDPDAAAIVLSSGMPITLVPLDITRQATLTMDAFYTGLADLAALPAVRFLSAATASYFKYRGATPTVRSAILHDPLALALTVVPDLAKYRPVEVTVDTEDGSALGRTRADGRIAADGPAQTISVAADLDVPRFEQFVVASLRHAATQSVPFCGIPEDRSPTCRPS
jgi:purine nucleosidase